MYPDNYRFRSKLGIEINDAAIGKAQITESYIRILMKLQIVNLFSSLGFEEPYAVSQFDLVRLGDQKTQDFEANRLTRFHSMV